MAHCLNKTNFFSAQEQVQGKSQGDSYAGTASAGTDSAFDDAILDITLAELDLLPLNQEPAFQSIVSSCEVPTTNSIWNQGHQVPDFQNGTEGGIPGPSNEVSSPRQPQMNTKYVSSSARELCLYSTDEYLP